MSDKIDNSEKKSKRSKGVQPKTHAKKDRVASKLRRKKIIKALIDGKTTQQAGVDAGLNPNSAAQQVTKILQEPLVIQGLMKAFEELDMDDKFIAEQHRALIMGTKVISAVVVNPPSSDADEREGRAPPDITRDFVEVPDFVAKGKGLDLYYRLTGKISNKHEVDIKQPVNIIVRKFCTPSNPNGVPDDKEKGQI